jgi:glycerol-1-phosphate dehydrogenase [NAD(P)+]
MARYAGSDLYGKTIACECGKTHVIEPHEVICSETALERLADLLETYARGRRVVVLADRRTTEVAGQKAAALLEQCGWRALQITLPDGPSGASPVCDDRTHEELARQIPEADILLPVGSGVVSDLGKWLAADLGLPYLCFATAASMNGYASANVAATIGGVKTVLRKHPPKAVLTTPGVLQTAPYEMTAAGLGDALAKSVSSADWRMNHLLFGDYYCERSVSLIADIEPLYTDHPEDLHRRSMEATTALFHGLLLTGVAMTMAETSAPASGAEHLLSHTLDMMSDLDGTPHDLHGRQVGIGTILASAIYRRVLDLESPDFREVPTEMDAGFWGPLAEVVKEHYAPKISRLGSAVGRLSRGDAWDRLRQEVQPFLRSPEQIRDCLRRAGAAFKADHIGCPRSRLLQALIHAHEMRSRFTVIDLARLAGVLPGAAAKIVEEWS